MTGHPHWEHGYRCHGYWIGIARIGFVGLPPRCGGGRVQSYGWTFETPGGKDITGRVKTLRQAKRNVEREYQKWKEALPKQK